jgi:arylsulfatase
MPAVLHGVPQEPRAGRSLAASLTDAAAPEHRETQYYEQFACRAIYDRGWKAVTYHAMLDGLYTDEDDPDRPFAEDRWELYHVASDPSESHGLAAAEPEKLRALQELWWSEAGRYGVLPLQSRRMFAVGRPHAVRPRERVVLRPGAAPVPEDLAPNVKMRPHRIVADVEIGVGGGRACWSHRAVASGLQPHMHGGSTTRPIGDRAHHGVEPATARGRPAPRRRCARAAGEPCAPSYLSKRRRRRGRGAAQRAPLRLAGEGLGSSTTMAPWWLTSASRPSRHRSDPRGGDRRRHAAADLVAELRCG